MSLSAQRISDAGITDISAIVEAKTNFTVAQKKMSTDLVFSGKAARFESLGAVPYRFASVMRPDQNGRVLVDIKANVTPDLLKEITAAGGTVVFQSAAYSAIRAELPLKNVEQIAGNTDVTFISAAAKAHTNVGAVTSQAYVSHRANQVINSMGFDGTGVRVGVLSDSALPGRVEALIASGDLPPDVTVLSGQEGPLGGENEGTAMMEIIHDMAPGAKLFFATAFNGEAAMASSIHDLRFVYHCDIIVDDVTYFDEGAYQDGVIARAVNAMVANGGLYFSSAANSGNLTYGTAGTWEKDFKGYSPSGTGPGIITSGEGPVLFNNFGTTAKPAYFDALTGLTNFISLKWADPLGKSKNDYDLFILDSTGSHLKAFSATAQTGTQDPFEAVEQGLGCGTPKETGYCPALGDQIVPVLYKGSGLPLRIETNRGNLLIATDGATYGHNAGASTITTAATYWGSAKRGLAPFTGFANSTEVFSSDGPRKIFFNPNGTPITPGNISFSKNGGTTLKKPDLTAADGVFTKTPGFLPFFGTSAAAPHAAAIAALVKSARPSLTNTQIKELLTTTALDTMATGWDRDSGAGIVMAEQAVQAAFSMY